MNDWFTVEKIDGDTFAISEYKHWEETHCYLLIGSHKALLIDTGLGVGNIKEAVDSITQLPVFVVTTHVHWDHIGGHRYFAHIGVFEKEKPWLYGNFPLPLSAVKESLMMEPCDFPDSFDINKYEVYQGEPEISFKDGHIIDLGNRKVEAIYTPGHSPGHVCFYERERGYLYSGDLIYEGCLYMFYPTTDPVAFMNSVKKVNKLCISRVLPGHHKLDTQADIIQHIDMGFEDIRKKGRLYRGSGIYDFGEFQIHM